MTSCICLFHLISISWSMWVLFFHDLYTIHLTWFWLSIHEHLSIVEDSRQKTCSYECNKVYFISICVWTYAYSLSSLFKFLELKLLLHQIPYFMQSRPLYVPYAHARSFIFIEKSVRSCTTKDTVYLESVSNLIDWDLKKNAQDHVWR